MAAPRATSRRERIVFRVTDIKAPGFDASSPNGQALDDMVSRQVSDDLFGQYVARLENDLGTTSIRPRSQQAVGNSAPDTN